MKKRTRFAAWGALLFLTLVFLADVARSQPASSQAPVPVPYYSPPTTMELCGERVPLDDPEVRERFDREFTLVVYGHAQVFLWLKRLERYFPWLEKQLKTHGLPDDLKFVAVAESDLILTACSPAGAVGPWQFISSTGARYELDQSKHVDERQDFELATASAFRYLKDLHALFQNWALAIAAYNCGENRIQQETSRQKTVSYYDLKLPLETERYIFRILAIKEVLSHPQRYGYSLPKDAAYPPVSYDRVKVSVSAPLPLQSVAEAAGMTYRDFKIANPVFVSDTLPSGTQAIKVPEGTGGRFQSRLQDLKTDYKPRLVTHKVKRGDTLSGIAAGHGVSTQDMRRWNGLKNDRVQVGQTLKIMK